MLKWVACCDIAFSERAVVQSQSNILLHDAVSSQCECFCDESCCRTLT